MFRTRSENTSHIVCTGMGAWTAYGKGIRRMWEGICEKKNVHQSIQERFPQIGLERYAALLSQEDWNEIEQDHPQTDPNIILSYVAAQEALAQSQAKTTGRWAIVLGNSNGGLYLEEDIAKQAQDDLNKKERKRLLEKSKLSSITSELSKKLDLPAHKITISTACASSNHALLIARELLSLQLVDAVLVGGTDVIHPTVIGGFHSVGAMSEQPCAPFSYPVGMSLGEGAGFMVLEREEDAQQRNAAVLAYLVGSGQSCDAFHATSPEPTGSGMSRSIQSALSDAGCSPDMIDFYDAHATGTLANDGAETSALDTVFPAPISVTAHKSWLGHTQGPAGILEAIVSICAIHQNHLPTIGNFSSPRNICPCGLEQSPPQKLRSFVKNSAAFGGSNVSTIFADAPIGTKKESHRVYIRGIGLAGNCQQQFPIGLNPPQKISKLAMLLRGTQAREFDGHARLLAVACQKALDDARQKKPKRDDIIGLIVATSTVPSQSEENHKDVIRKGSLQQVSARAFAMGVRNSACGAVNRIFNLRGPDCTYVSGEGSGLHSLLHGYALLSKSRQWSTLIAAGVDEPSNITKTHQDLLYEHSKIPQEGGVGLVLSNSKTDDSMVYIDGWKVCSFEEGEKAIVEHLKQYEHGIIYDVSQSPLPRVLDYSQAYGWTFQSSDYFGEAHSPLLGVAIVAQQLQENIDTRGLIICASKDSGLIMCSLSRSQNGTTGNEVYTVSTRDH